VSELEAEFPAVTFCNLNSIDFVQNANTNSLMANIFFNNSNSISPFVNVSDSEDALTQVSLVSTIVKVSLISSLSLSSVFDLGFSLDKMLISCFSNRVRCKMTDFYQYYDFEFGNCYTFNSAFANNGSGERSPIMTTEPGPKSGINII
jgi:hypothetical protein